MKTPKIVILAVCTLTLNMFMTSCSKNSENAIISAADMFPPASAFGDNCSVNKDMSDSVALEIIEGTYSEPSEDNERSMPYTQCSYENPNVNVSISRFTSVEKCNEEYTKGLETFKKSQEITALDGYDVEGYRYKMGSRPGCCFKYGNVAVILFLYDEDNEDLIIKTLIKHFEAKKK